MSNADTGSLARRFTHDRMELPNGAQPDCDVDKEVSTESAVLPPADLITPSAEQVARVVAGVLTIGQARDALTRAGWRARIAGNRITVNDEVLADFRAGGVDARWVIYDFADTRSVWVVGAEGQP